MSQGHIQRLEDQLKEFRTELERVEALEQEIDKQIRSLGKERQNQQQKSSSNQTEDTRYIDLDNKLKHLTREIDAIRSEKEKLFQEEEQINLQIINIQNQAEKMMHHKMETDLTFRDKMIIERFLEDKQFKNINHDRGYENPRVRYSASKEQGASYLLRSPLFSALRELLITNLSSENRHYLENQVIPAVIRAKPNDIEDKDILILAIFSGNLGLLKSLFSAGLNPNYLFQKASGTRDETIAQLIKASGIKGMPAVFSNKDDITIFELAEKLKTVHPKFQEVCQYLEREMQRCPEEGDTPLMIALKTHDIDALEKLVFNPTVNVLAKNLNNSDIGAIAKRIMPEFFVEGNEQLTIVSEGELYRILAENIIKEDPELERFYKNISEENAGHKQKANKLFVLKIRPEVERLYHILSKIDKRAKDIAKRDNVENIFGKMAAVKSHELIKQQQIKAQQEARSAPHPKKKTIESVKHSQPLHQKPQQQKLQQQKSATLREEIQKPNRGAVKDSSAQQPSNPKAANKPSLEKSKVKLQLIGKKVDNQKTMGKQKPSNKQKLIGKQKSAEKNGKVKPNSIAQLKAKSHLKAKPLTPDIKQRIEASRQTAHLNRAQVREQSAKMGRTQNEFYRTAGKITAKREPKAVMTIDETIGITLSGVPKDLFKELYQGEVDRSKNYADHPVLGGKIKKVSNNAYTVIPKKGVQVISIQHQPSKNEIDILAMTSKGKTGILDLKRTIGAGLAILKEHYLDNPNVEPITFIVETPEMLKNVIKAFGELAIIDRLSSKHQTPFLNIQIKSEFRGDIETMLEIADSVDLGVVNREESEAIVQRKTGKKSK